MATQPEKKGRGRRRVLQDSGVPLTRKNYTIFAISIVVILIGYWALAQHPVDGFMTLSVAPILLIIGYCVLIPIAIMIGGKKQGDQP